LGIGKRQRGREKGAEGKEVIFYSPPCPLLLAQSPKLQIFIKAL
jgi:hypothetical protein